MGRRPTDWWVLDLDNDPVPGDPDRMRNLSKKLLDFADDVHGALRSVKGLEREDAILTWAGKSADAFREEFDGIPGNLTKLENSYRKAGDALSYYWPKLRESQETADRALRDGREARDDLTTARTRLTNANDHLRIAARKVNDHNGTENSGGGNIPPPDEAQVRQATRNHTQAQASQTTAQTAVTSAESALAAAKRLAEQARDLRQDAARHTVAKLSEASDAGIQNRNWLEEGVDWVSDNWDEIVTVCKWVVGVLGIIVMIIGGPLGWLVFAAALVVLADTVKKMIEGTAGPWDFFWAVLDCIPAAKGITTLAKLGTLWKAGGLRALGGAFMHGIGGGLRNISQMMRRSATMGTRRYWKALHGKDSKIPVPPTRKPHDELITGDAVYFSKHSTAVGYDGATLRNFDKVKPEPGYHDVVVHGTNEGMTVPGRVNNFGEEFGSELNPNHVADAVRGNPAYSGEPIRLISCRSGATADDFSGLSVGQQMANNLGVPVKAPTTPVGTANALGPGQVPQIYDGGSWRTFLPMTS